MDLEISEDDSPSRVRSMAGANLEEAPTECAVATENVHEFELPENDGLPVGSSSYQRFSFKRSLSANLECDNSKRMCVEPLVEVSEVSEESDFATELLNSLTGDFPDQTVCPAIPDDAQLPTHIPEEIIANTVYDDQPAETSLEALEKTFFSEETLPREKISFPEEIQPTKSPALHLKSSLISEASNMDISSVIADDGGEKNTDCLDVELVDIEKSEDSGQRNEGTVIIPDEKFENQPSPILAQPTDEPHQEESESNVEVGLGLLFSVCASPRTPLFGSKFCFLFT